VRQATATAPLLPPPRILRTREVAAANAAQLLVIAAAFGFQVLITFHMQRALGYRAAASGLGLVPTAVLIGGGISRLVGQAERPVRPAGSCGQARPNRTRCAT
jgi:hypothetical protein